MRVALLNDDDLSALRSSFGEANGKDPSTSREESVPFFFFPSRYDVNRRALRRLYGDAAWNERREHTSVNEEIREERERSVSFKVLLEIFFGFFFYRVGGLISTTLGFSKLAPNERPSTLSLSLRLQNQTNRSVT